MAAIAVVWCPFLFQFRRGLSMIITFKVILLIIILISFIGAVGETEDMKLRNNMTYICIFSIISMLAMVVLL